MNIDMTMSREEFSRYRELCIFMGWMPGTAAFAIRHEDPEWVLVLNRDLSDGEKVQVVGWAMSMPGMELRLRNAMTDADKAAFIQKNETVLTERLRVFLAGEGFDPNRIKRVSFSGPLKSRPGKSGLEIEFEPDLTNEEAAKLQGAMQKLSDLFGGTTVEMVVER